MKDFAQLFPEGGTADGVNEWVVAAVAHGQPVRNKEDEINVVEIIDTWITEKNYEICLIWKPAETEDDDNSDQHDDGPLLVLQDHKVLCCHSNSWGDSLPQAQGYTDVGKAHHKEGKDVFKDDQEDVVEIEDLHLYMSTLH